MSDYDNTNRGALFHNNKEGNESRPDYTGEINVEGKDLRIAAWIKKSKAGNSYMSLSVSEKEQRQEPAQAQPRDFAPPADDFEEDIPFSGVGA